MSFDHQKAAEEIRKFRQMFGALFALGEKLEDIGQLEWAAANLQTQVDFLKDREAKILKVGTLEEAAGQIERRISILREAEAANEGRRRHLQGEADAFEERFAALEKKISEREKYLSEIEDRIQQIRKKIEN